jgi:hypothetical protein
MTILTSSPWLLQTKTTDQRSCAHFVDPLQNPKTRDPSVATASQFRASALVSLLIVEKYGLGINSSVKMVLRTFA